MVQDARKFKYSSDYPQPLVGFRAQYTVTVAQGQSAAQYKIRHNLPYIPLLLGKFSSYSDFRTYHDINDINGARDGYVVNLYSDEEYVTIIISASDYQSQRTAYIKVVGLIPPDFAGDAPILPSDTNFNFDTDKNYLGIYKQGAFVPTTTSTDIPHALNYKPKCMAWIKHQDRFRQQGGVGPILFEPVGYSNFGPVSYSNKITIPAVYQPQGKGYYQIYTLEA